jgi:putative phage-type endonuclease
VKLPAGTILGPYETRSEWLEARRAGLGGSDIGTILGLSSFSSELEVYYSKVEGREPEQTEQMRNGQREEPRILDDWVEDHPEHDYNLFRDRIIIQSDIHPYLMHSPDALGEEYPDGGVYFGVEVKNIRADHNWDPLPPFYMAQVQHGLLCSGLERWIVVAKVAGQKYITREIEPDREMQGRIAIEAERFWKAHILPQIPPEPDGSDSAKRALERKWDRSEGSVEIPAGIWSTVDYQARRKKAVAKDYAKAVQMVQSIMGTAETALVDGKKVATWRVGTRKSVDLERLRAEAPEIAKKFEKVDGTRRFLPTRGIFNEA